ncbi:MAG: hypothetical protein J0L97_08995 [Alphaproteobacteria bacterium]|nr:hypothetical protein [Alphaproteobacteria bacterium]
MKSLLQDLAAHGITLPIAGSSFRRHGAFEHVYGTPDLREGGDVIVDMTGFQYFKWFNVLNASITGRDDIVFIGTRAELRAIYDLGLANLQDCVGRMGLSLEAVSQIYADDVNLFNFRRELLPALYANQEPMIITPFAPEKLFQRAIGNASVPVVTASNITITL